MTNLLTRLLVIKEHLKNIYTRYSFYIDKLVKFMLAFVSFILINSNLGYVEILTNPAIGLGLALICAFLPINMTVFVSAAIILTHLYKLSLEITIITMLIMVLMIVLYLRFTPKEAMIVLLTPLAFVLKIPYIIPLAVGVVGTPVSAVSVSCGVLIYYIVHNVKEYSAAIGNTESSAVVAQLNFYKEKIFQDRLVLITMLTFVLMVLVVYYVKRLSIDYAWSIAVGSGGLTGIVIMLVGDFALDIKISYLGLFAGTIISFFLVFILQFFLFSVDYTRTERVQFEDDEYYYYVKAVPKISMTVERKEVKRINPRRHRSFGRKAQQEEENTVEGAVDNPDFLTDNPDSIEETAALAEEVMDPVEETEELAEEFIDPVEEAGEPAEEVVDSVEEAEELAEDIVGSSEDED